MGKLVLVTGATGGLGQTVVQGFRDCFRDSGVRVIATARQASDPADQDFIGADLSSEKEATRLLDRIVSAYGPLDVIIHTMGGWAGGTQIEDTAADTWRRMFAINLDSAFFLLHAAIPHIRDGGRILAISSQAALASAPTMAAYAASKAALNELIQTAAAELAPRKITANVVAPTTIDTPNNRAAMPNADTSNWISPQDLTDLLIWLCSDAAKQISGAVIPVGISQ
jgi:NAD(P)-dependent dehydrogenase (short-subunit alcohol dehydrogenase family)